MRLMNTDQSSSGELFGSMQQKPKWELNEVALSRLLAAFSDYHEEAGEKYLLLRRNLVRYFEVRGINSAEFAADEVINRLAKKLEAGEEFENINTYALGVARLHSLELRRSPEQRTSNELPEQIDSKSEPETSEHEEKLSCLDDCLSNMSGEKKDLIVGYYRGERREKIENRRKLSEELGIPANALRSRAVRLRAKLESCITKCLQKKGFGLL